MVSPLNINIIYDKSVIELNNDITLLQTILKNVQTIVNHPIGKPRLLDMKEPHIHCDIQIHINTPIFSAVPWGKTNIMFINSWNESFNAYMHAFDAIISNKSFDTSIISDNSKLYNIKWNTEWNNDSASIDNGVNTIFSDIFKILINLVNERKSWCKHYPPVVYHDECPPISIITPTYSRSKLIDIAFHNILATDYPADKIEWVVIEDNESKDKMNTESIMSFQIQVPKIKLKYIPIEGRMSIGEKRNLGIENATNDIILFMDDDDHYPSTSFRRRVSWLLKGQKGGQKPGTAEIACCTTLALYDLKRGVSAVNVPPYDIPFAQRISEATLTFKKSAWLERKFLDVSISEGEEWISGREDKVIEIPPQQIIVAFTHGDNKSGRRIPPSDTPPGCFWGFPKEYLIFIHKLAGVEVEDEREKTKK
jgi:hypothetical protein